MNNPNNIKKVLKEALGVPENIYEVSKNAYSRILNWVKRLTEDDFEGGQGANTVLRVEFKIADSRFSTLKLKLGVDEHPKVVEPEMISMAVRSQSRKTDDFRLENVKTKTIDLVMVMVVPVGFDYDELPKYFDENKNEIITNLSHEFKHVYDHFKKKGENPADRASYQTAVQFGFDVEPLDRFLHDIYFTSVSENLVRPTEISTAIRNGQISQKGFLDFLRSNDTYRNLKRISEFNIEDFKKEILKNKKSVNRLLKHLRYIPSTMTDEQKISAVFKALYVNIVNSRVESFIEILKTNFLEDLIGFQGEKEKILKRFINKTSRFNNPEDFIRYYEKFFHYIGKEMIKKISKLYAITGK